ITGDIAADGILEYGSTPTYLESGDLTINGIDIFSHATAITSGDSSNTLINAINAKTDQTGVKAGRNNAGQIILSAVDGRNLHIQTSALGEKVTQLNGGTAPQDQVYFGELRLWGAKEFFMNSNTTTVGALTNYETGFNALGLAGGATVTGQTGDAADDGTIFVNTITYENGYVRYAGDRKNDFAVKVGQQSTIDVGKNGKSAVMDTGIFAILKSFQDALRGQNFTTVNGAAKALDTSALMNSGKTGLTLENELQNGSFTIAVSNHDTSPSTTSSVTINIDTAKDSLADIANRINGIPGISSSWSEDGHLQINSNDPERYTFALSNDTSNFLRATGSETDNAQISNISKSIADLDGLMQNLTTQISDFGARANRIIVQQQIYSNLELSTRENLSEKEDTDLTKALLELKGKETAYEAALSAAAKTMQLSLLDFLR
ncbi:MAG: flagellin hook IN motif-containing protein, partial [Pseudomonadota bacterium]